MKREIKFRGISIDSGKMVCGDLIQYKSGRDIWTDDDGRVFINPETIGQFTGLRDKNGVEIYEGDIVHDEVGHCVYIFKFGTIQHNVKSKLTDQINDVSVTGFYVDIPKVGNELFLWSTVKESEIEVIGNIHQNPELFCGEDLTGMILTDEAEIVKIDGIDYKVMPETARGVCYECAFEFDECPENPCNGIIFKEVEK